MSNPGLDNSFCGAWQIRADLFYSSIVAAPGGEMTWLGGHINNLGITSDYHMHIAMFAAPGTDAYNRLRLENASSTRWGLRYGFISGTKRW